MSNILLTTGGAHPFPVLSSLSAASLRPFSRGQSLGRLLMAIGFLLTLWLAAPQPSFAGLPSKSSFESWQTYLERNKQRVFAEMHRVFFGEASSVTVHTVIDETDTTYEHVEFTLYWKDMGGKPGTTRARIRSASGNIRDVKVLKTSGLKKETSDAAWKLLWELMTEPSSE